MYEVLNIFAAVGARQVCVPTLTIVHRLSACSASYRQYYSSFFRTHMTLDLMLGIAQSLTSALLVCVAREHDL